MYQAPSSIQLGIGVKTTVGKPQMTGTQIPQQTQLQRQESREKNQNNNNNNNFKREKERERNTSLHRWQYI